MLNTLKDSDYRIPECENAYDWICETPLRFKKWFNRIIDEHITVPNFIRAYRRNTNSDLFENVGYLNEFISKGVSELNLPHKYLHQYVEWNNLGYLWYRYGVMFNYLDNIENVIDFYEVERFFQDLYEDLNFDQKNCPNDMNGTSNLYPHGLWPICQLTTKQWAEATLTNQKFCDDTTKITGALGLLLNEDKNYKSQNHILQETISNVLVYDCMANFNEYVIQHVGDPQTYFWNYLEQPKECRIYKINGSLVTEANQYGSSGKFQATTKTYQWRSDWNTSVTPVESILGFKEDLDAYCTNLCNDKKCSKGNQMQKNRLSMDGWTDCANALWMTCTTNHLMDEKKVKDPIYTTSTLNLESNTDRVTFTEACHLYIQQKKRCTTIFTAAGNSKSPKRVDC